VGCVADAAAPNPRRSDEGETASRNRIARLMAKNGIYGIP